MDQHDIGQHLDQLGTRESTPDLDGQTFPAELVEQRQQPQSAPIMGGVMNEIIGPHVIPMGWP